MRKFGIILLILLLSVHCCAWSVMAADSTVSEGCATLQARYALHTQTASVAQAAILYEMDSQTLLYAQCPDDKIDPTGLVKIMTALVTLENADVAEAVTVRQSTLNTLPSGARRIGLLDGDVLTVGDLLACMMVASANDAAVVLAEYVSGSQQDFVALMNRRAAELGCSGSCFANVHGLSNDAQYSTVRDMAVITARALELEDFVRIFGTAVYSLPENLSCARTLTTTNAMMDSTSKYYDGRITGGKNAKTSQYASMICTAQTENGRYLCVMSAVAERSSGYALSYQQMSALMDIGLNGYSVQQVLGSAQPYTMYAVSNGENSVVVGADRDVFALLPKSYDPTLLQFEQTHDAQSLQAPIKAGTEVGKIIVRYDGVVVAQAALLARHDVAVSGQRVQAAQGENGSILRQIFKWAGIAVALLVVAVAAALVILRRVNISRYRKKQANRHAKEESNELE